MSLSHPDAPRDFLRGAKKRKMRAAVLEIPLLFETGADKRCDVVLCVTAPAAVQKKRVMARSGMTMARFKAIVALQTPDREKRRRADYVIETGKSYAHTQKRLKTVVSSLLKPNM